ncbi:MAG TPA: hypothetical protein VNJ28_02735, partial [Candidatus Limnocylindrales bacterium]|nr:hypothetical protein [Candidatus Limnocylindrales bacterium]
MAARLQMKLGLVAEQDRLPDSPDTTVIVEPSVGSVARSKGNLYLLVVSRQPGSRAREATRSVAETIRSEYYYDESAGVRGALQKAISTANKRLLHQRDRYGLGGGPSGGPIGVALAVIRGSELYVATVGPAEAYLVRQARLSTLPDPYRERGLPAPGIEPEVWRGEVAVGDSLVLVSSNVIARLGPEELKEVLLTLHPQPAMERLHARFVESEGSGSDGAIALEVAQVPATHPTRTLVPVWPPEPLAGAPDRSPIPLADTVSGGVAAVQASARQARTAAGGALVRLAWRLQDLLLPPREPARRRVTPTSARRETQRRAAIALLAFVFVAGGLGFAVYVAGGGGERPRTELTSLTVGQAALARAEEALGRVFAPGVDLVRDDPVKAEELLVEAYEALGEAAEAGIPARTIGPLRERVVGGLDALYRVVPVAARPVFTFEAAEPPPDLDAIVVGPDGAPYVLDRGSRTVYRVDLAEGTASAILRAGQTAAGAEAAEPRFLTVAGPDVLILDERNTLWRWRPADRTGRGTLRRIRVTGAAEWGDDVRGIGTYCRNAPDCDLYNLYVIDPSERQILAYSPAADGSGYPARPTGRLATAQAVDGF